MQPKTSPTISTRIENLSLEPDGAKFVLDGRAVKIAREASEPSVTALQAFYQSALADYQAQPPAPKPGGWLARLRSWFGRWNALPPTRSSTPTANPAPQQQTAPPHHPTPTLRAAFGDKNGVHLNWQTPPSPEVQNLNYPLDSALAERLQDCYGHLAELGYKVVGLDLLKAAPEKGLTADGAKSERHPTAHGAEEGVEDNTLHPKTGAKEPIVSRNLKKEAGAEAPMVSHKAKTGTVLPAEAKERTIVMRVEPNRPERRVAQPESRESQTSPPPAAMTLPRETVPLPHGALSHPHGARAPHEAGAVAPKENEKAHVLAAPARLMQALQVAADPEQPAGERLTFLRCSLGKEGLKIIDVGLGEGKEHGPARWEDAAKWLALQVEPEAPRKRVRSAPEAAAPATRVAGPEPGL